MPVILKSLSKFQLSCSKPSGAMMISWFQCFIEFSIISSLAVSRIAINCLSVRILCCVWQRRQYSQKWISPLIIFVSVELPRLSIVSSHPVRRHFNLTSRKVFVSFFLSGQEITEKHKRSKQIYKCHSTVSTPPHRMFIQMCVRVCPRARVSHQPLCHLSVATSIKPPPSIISFTRFLNPTGETKVYNNAA